MATLQSEVIGPSPGISAVQHIPAFEDGQVLGRTLYRSLFENDQFFNGYADRRIAVPNGGCRRFIADELSHVLFDGYIYLDSEHTLLNYYIAVLCDGNPDELADEEPHVDLWFDGTDITGDIVGGVHDDTGAALVEELSTFDASGYPDGIHRVYAVLHRGASGHNATGYCAAPWLTYTGALAYAAVPAIADAAVPTAANSFNIWRANDTFFESQLSPNHPTVACETRTIAASVNVIIWAGWVQAPAATNNRIWWHIRLDETGTANLEGIFDYFDVVGHEHFKTASSDQDNEGHFDLVNAYTPGDLYCVVWRLSTEVASAADADIVYTAIDTQVIDPAFTVPGEPAVNQYVFGDTAGETTRADLLSDNDTALNARETLVYRRYATKNAESYDDNATDGTWSYTFERQGNELWYKGSGLEISYGNGSTETLPDTTDYAVVDLREIRDLPYGAQYTVSGTDLDWAMEVL